MATIVGAETVARRLRAFADDVREPLREAVSEGAETVRAAAITAMRGSKSGRVYRTPGGPRRASAPGEAPAVVSGRLIDSLAVRASDDGLTARVGVEDPAAATYARSLEFGTSKMAARPWLVPALEASRDEIERRIRETLRAAIRKADRGART
jgi:HK97 gp10 family phage protein